MKPNTLENISYSSQVHVNENPTNSKHVPKSNWALILVCMAFIVHAILNSTKGQFDNDMWWLLATGREIVLNSLPYINPWSLIDNLQTVIQQWIPASILWISYSTFGYLGIRFLTLVLFSVFCLALFLLCRITSQQKRGHGEIFALIIALGFITFPAYLSIRPHVYTMTIMVTLIALLELYRIRKNKIYVYLLPILTCIHVNVHAAMAPFDLFIIGLYLLPDLPTLFQKKYHVRAKIGFYLFDYQRKPLLIAAIVAALAMLINPYGIKGALYLFLSYDSANYYNYINEMRSTGFWTNYGKGAMAMIVLGSLAIGHNGLKKIDLPLSLLFFICIPLSMMHTRNIWLVSLCAVPLLARSFRNLRINTENGKFFSNKAIYISALVLLTAICVTQTITQQWSLNNETAESDSGNTPTKAIAYLDNYVQNSGINAKDVRIYNNFNNGGYIEFRGYKVFMDARPELWEPPITGNETHYFQDYVLNLSSTEGCEHDINTYQFDFCIATSNKKMFEYLQKRNDYEELVSGVGYSLFAKKDLNARFVVSSTQNKTSLDKNNTKDPIERYVEGTLQTPDLQAPEKGSRMY